MPINKPSHPWLTKETISIKSRIHNHQRACLDALTQLFKHSLFSLLFISVISLFFMLILSIDLTQKHIQHQIDQHLKEQDVSAYFHSKFKEKQSINELLEKSTAILKWQWITPDDALTALLSTQEISDQAVFNDFQLPITLHLYLTPSTTKFPNHLSKQITKHPLFESFSFQEKNSAHWNSLKKTLQRLKHLFSSISLFAFFIILYLCSYLLIHRNKEEIYLFNRIGATLPFIQLPFLYHHFWLSFFGMLLGCLLTYYLLDSLLPLLNSLFYLPSEKSISLFFPSKSSFIHAISILSIGLLASNVSTHFQIKYLLISNTNKHITSKLNKSVSTHLSKVFTYLKK